MHDIKEAIYENKSKLEGIGEDYQIQVSNDRFSVLSWQHPAIPLFREVDDAWFLTASAAILMFGLR